MAGRMTCNRCAAELDEPAMGSLCPRCLWHDAVLSQQAENRGGSSAPPLRVFGDYELLEEIGRGGMGVVYKARQISLNRLVALKMILSGNLASAAEVRRFHAEAEAAASLDHPHIVPVYEVGTHEGQHFFSMKLMDHGLASDLSRSDHDQRWAADLVSAIAYAVHHAHQRGILHRDLKPGNILFDADGQPYVTDFGLACQMSQDSCLTLTGQLLGTPSYMAPEIAAGGASKASVFADIYSLGAVLYELLAGHPPFAENTALATVQQVRDGEPKRPSAIDRRVDRNLETICLKCLEKDPQRRYKSALELADDLHRWREGRTILARPAGRTEKFWRWCRRRPLIASLSAALLLILVLGVSGIVWQWRRAVSGELDALRNGYAADMSAVQQSLEDGNLGQARALLYRNRPRPGQPDLRGWEWRYRWQQCQKDPAFLGEIGYCPGRIWHISVSPDSRWLAAGTSQGQAVLFDLSGRAPSQVLQNQSQMKAVVAFAPTGNVLAWTSHDGQSGQIHLHDVATDKEIRTLRHVERAPAIAWSADAKLLAVLTTDETVKLWNLDSAASEPFKSLHVPMTPRWKGLLDVAISPRRDLLAASDGYGRIHVFRLPNGEPVVNFRANDEAVRALAFSSDGMILASCGGLADRFIGLWDPMSGRPIAPRLAGHNRFAHDLAFSPKGEILASAGADQLIRLWAIPSGRQASVLRGHALEVTSIAFAPDGRTLYSGTKDGHIWRWNTEIQPSQDVQIVRTDRILQLAFLPGGRSAAVAKSTGSVCLWDMAGMKELKTIDHLGNGALLAIPHYSAYLAASPDGRLLAVRTLAGEVRVWDLDSQQVVARMPAGEGADSVGVAFSGNGQRLLVSDAQSHTIWDVSTWKPVAKLPTDKTVASAALSHDGLSYARLSGGTVAIWDVPRGFQRVLPVRDVSCIAFSPDGRILATGNDNSTLLFWDTRTWQKLGPPLQGHLTSVNDLAFSPDGKRLAATGGCGQEAMLLWDVPTRRQVARLEGEGSLYQSPAFGPDGNTITAIPYEGYLHVWRAPSMDQIRASEKKEGLD